MKTLNTILALVFLLFAAVQYNDPDPMQWILVYGAVAVLCMLAARGRTSPVPIIALTAGVAGWMLVLLPGMIDWFSMGMPSIVGTMQADAPHIEVVREFLGLGIALAALVHLLLLSRRASKAEGLR